MNVINTGESIELSASYSEMAGIIEAIRKAVTVYKREGSPEIAEELTVVLEQIMDPEIKLY